MNCLVTGGAGFIGSNLVDELLAKGHAVTVLDDLSSGYRENLAHLDGQEDFRFLEGDVRDEALLAEATRGQEAVFHLAASVGNKRSIDNPLTDADINVMGTLKVLEAARRAGCRKMVSSSSAGIFGELEDPAQSPRTTRWNPTPPYGCTQTVRGEAVSGPTPSSTSWKRWRCGTSTSTDPRQRFDAYGNVIPIFVFQALRGEPITVFGDGETGPGISCTFGTWSRSNVKAALSRGVSGAFNIASGTRITLNDLVDLLRETGLSPKVLSGPPRPGDVRHSLADLRQARSLLGFEPRVDLREGLQEYVAWAREEAAR